MNMQSQQWATDIKGLVDDAEELVRATATATDNKVVELRRRMQETVNTLKPHIARIEAAVTERAKSAAKTTDRYVHDNPWAATGISAGIGLLLGLLIGRR
jgi:ElaB/YqjD/DUF883 family membrane-anchored ribosome-binding protein